MINHFYVQLVILIEQIIYPVTNTPIHRKMNLPVHIPLGKIKGTKSVSKIELTYIDQHLNKEQKKQIAKFYREEAASRTQYKIEPTWTMPESMLAVKPGVQECPPDLHTPTLYAHPQDESHSDTRNQPELDEHESDILELHTSPIPEENCKEEEFNTVGEVTEENPVEEIVNTLWENHHGSYRTIRQSLFTAKKFLPGLENLSRTQMKRNLYREKLEHIKTLKRQHTS